MAASTASIPGLVAHLSERELEVLRLMAAGERNQDIANELYVALNTVKNTPRTSPTSSAQPTAPKRPPAARALGLIP